MEELRKRIEKHPTNLWEDDKVLKRNEYLKVAGSTDTKLYYVVSGSLRAFIHDEYEEQTIRFGYEGSMIADLESFIMEQPSDFYIQAIKKTRIKVLTKKAFNDFLQSDVQHLVLWQKLMEMTIYQQLERERDILTSSPVERYRRVLARSPQLFQNIPSKYIASYLRMTPETLSRIKKR